MLGAAIVITATAAVVTLRPEPTPTSRYGLAYRALCHTLEEASAGRRSVARDSYVAGVRNPLQELADEIRPSAPDASERLRLAATDAERALQTGSELPNTLEALVGITRQAMVAVGEARPPSCALAS